MPGVQVTSDSVRGPSAGASGQDNGYRFDGANLSVPLFGILASSPSTHDVAHVSVERGGARAVPAVAAVPATPGPQELKFLQLTTWAAMLVEGASRLQSSPGIRSSSSSRSRVCSVLRAVRTV